jgi:hypothetical protein
MDQKVSSNYGLGLGSRTGCVAGPREEPEAGGRVAIEAESAAAAAAAATIADAPVALSTSAAAFAPGGSWGVAHRSTPSMTSRIPSGTGPSISVAASCGSTAAVPVGTATARVGVVSRFDPLRD